MSASVAPPPAVRWDSHGAVSQTVAHPPTVPTAAQPSWIKSGSGYSEAQTFYLFPKSGGVAFVQVAYSEVGVSPLAQVTVSFRTKAVNTFKSYNYSGSSLKIAADGCGSTCQDYSVTRRASGHYAVSFKSKDVSFAFDAAFSAPSDIATVGDGKIHFTQPGGSARPDGFLSQVYGLRGALKGSATVQGVLVDLDGGECNVVQQHQGIAPHKLAQEWDFFTVASPSVAAASVAGITPSTYAGAPFSTIAARIPSADGGAPTVAVSTNVKYEFRTSTTDPATGYAVPTHAAITATLNTGHVLEVTTPLNFGSVMRVDVLGELPWLVRKAIAMFISKPFLYQFAEQARIVLRDAHGAVIADEASEAFVEVSFTNPSS